MDKSTARCRRIISLYCTFKEFLIRPKAWNFIKKETLTQLFSCEFCEISKNTLLHRTHLVTASENYFPYHCTCKDFTHL